MPVNSQIKSELDKGAQALSEGFEALISYVTEQYIERAKKELEVKLREAILGASVGVYNNIKMNTLDQKIIIEINLNTLKEFRDARQSKTD